MSQPDRTINRGRSGAWAVRAGSFARGAMRLKTGTAGPGADVMLG